MRRLLGYVPQELAFYADMSALDTALFYARLKSTPHGARPRCWIRSGWQSMATSRWARCRAA